MTDPILDPDWSDPNNFLVRVKRPDGGSQLLLVPNEHYDRILELSIGEFADTSIQAIEPKGKHRA